MILVTLLYVLDDSFVLFVDRAVLLQQTDIVNLLFKSFSTIDVLQVGFLFLLIWVEERFWKVCCGYCFSDRE